MVFTIEIDGFLIIFSYEKNQLNNIILKSIVILAL